MKGLTYMFDIGMVLVIILIATFRFCVDHLFDSIVNQINLVFSFLNNMKLICLSLFSQKHKFSFRFSIVFFFFVADINYTENLMS